MRRGLLLVAAAAVVLSPGSHGTSNPVSLSVALNVPASCTVSGATLAFGASNGDPVSAEALVSVECNQGQAWRLAADAGQSFDGDTRRMESAGGSHVPYLLYRDEALLVEMGDEGEGGSYVAGSPIDGTGTGTAQSVSIFGLVPAFPAGLPAGEYTDEVLLTLAF